MTSLKRSSAYASSMIVGIMLLSTVVLPYFLHDFRLTLQRTDYVDEENRTFSATRFDPEIIKKLDLRDVFIEADKAYETTKGCTDDEAVYSGACQIQVNVRAYHAYNIIELLRFNSFPSNPGYYTVVLEDEDKQYSVNLQSINWIQYVTLGAVISVIGVLFSVWLLVRYEKHISNTQNHLIGITLGIFSVSIVILLLIISQSEMLMGVLIPSPYVMLFAGIPFMTTYAIWYHMIGKRFVNNEKLQESIE